MVKRSTLLYLFIAFYVVSCSSGKKNIDNIPINSLKDITDNISPQPQAFEIDPSQENIIKGEKGSQIYFPPNIFELENGSAPLGKVQIELKECFSHSDLFAEGLSTASGNFLLQTAGMLQISAKADGKELSVKKDASYVIAFPRNGKKDTMALFYGRKNDKGVLDWIPDRSSFPTMGFGEGASGISDTSLLDSSLYHYAMRVAGYTCGTGIPNTNNVSWKFKNSDSSVFNYLPRNFTSQFYLKKIFEEGKIIMMELTISKDGKVTNVVIDKNSERSKYENVFIDFIKKMPALDMRSMGGYNPDMKYSLDLNCEVILDEKKYKERFNQKYSKYRTQAISRIDKADLNYYIVSATKFNWINCDKFWNTTDEKIDFAVKPNSANDSKVQIVFSDISSIMEGVKEGENFVFKNVPIGRKVKVIGISYANGKPMMASSETKTEKTNYTLEGYKEFTLTELEKKLNDL